MTAREEWERLEAAWSEWRQRKAGSDNEGAQSFPDAARLLELRREFGWHTGRRQSQAGIPVPPAPARR